MSAKLARWLIFGVIMASLPVFFNLLRMATRGADVTIANLTGRGELLLVAAGIAAAAIGDLIASGTQCEAGKILAGGGAVIVLFIASLYFADISVGFLKGEALDAWIICRTSLALFGSAVIASGSCVVLAAVK